VQRELNDLTAELVDDGEWHAAAVVIDAVAAEEALIGHCFIP